MVLSELEKIKLLIEQFDFQIYRPKNNVLLTVDVPDLTDNEALKSLLAAGCFKKICHRAPIKPMFRYVASGDLPAATASKALSNVTTPDWKDFLKPSMNIFYDILLEFNSSHYTQWKVEEAGTELGWIRSTDDDDEKFVNGQVIHLISTEMDHPGKYSPNFTIDNKSQSTLDFALARIIYGWKYSVRSISGEVPANYSPVSIRDVDST